MNKLAKSCLLIAFTALAIVGTRAYYTTTITSSGNTITSANFSVKPDGNLDGNQEFKIENFAPGKSQIYKFSIDKTGTQVPVVYNINFLKSEELFAGNTPVKLTLVKYSDDTNYEIINAASVDNSYILYPQNNTETYGLKVDWSWDSSSDTDSTNYAGKTGSITINVKASQLITDPLETSNNENTLSTTATVTVRDEINKNSKGMETFTINNGETVIYDASSKVLKINQNNYFGNMAFQINDVLTSSTLIYCTNDITYTEADGSIAHCAGSNGWSVYKDNDGKLLIFTKSITYSDKTTKKISVRVEGLTSIIN